MANLASTDVAIRLIKHAMHTMMPRAASLPGIADTDLDGFLRRMRVEADPFYWLGLLLGAWLFALTPLLTVFLPLPSFWLPKRLLDRHANRLLAHPVYLLRVGVNLVRLSAGMCWGADRDVRACFALPPFAPDPGTFRTS
jgi:hypothetical protein